LILLCHSILLFFQTLLQPNPLINLSSFSIRCYLRFLLCCTHHLIEYSIFNFICLLYIRHTTYRLKLSWLCGIHLLKKITIYSFFTILNETNSTHSLLKPSCRYTPYYRITISIGIYWLSQSMGPCPFFPLYFPNWYQCLFPCTLHPPNIHLLFHQLICNLYCFMIDSLNQLDSTPIFNTLISLVPPETSPSHQYWWILATHSKILVFHVEFPIRLQI
jgi:hypothetical protein